MVFPSQNLLAELTPVRLNNPNCQALGNFQTSVKWMNFRYFLEIQFLCWGIWVFAESFVSLVEKNNAVALDSSVIAVSLSGFVTTHCTAACINRAKCPGL